MTLLDSLLRQGQRAFREPRAAAADVLALGVPQSAVFPAFILVVALSVLLNAASEFVAPSPLSVLPPFRIFMIMFVLTGTLAFGVAKIGRAFGGQGDVQQSLLLAVFLQAVFLPVQALNLILLILLPMLAQLVQVGILVFGIWMNLNFVAALHGFNGLGRAAAVLFLASLVVAIGMLIFAPVLGFVPVGGPPNV